MAIPVIIVTYNQLQISNDTQIRVIGSMEPETFTKMLKKLSEKPRAKFPATAHGYSMVKFACRDDAFSEFFELEASPVEGQSLQQKGKKRRKRKGKKHVANAFLARLELIGPISSLKISKMCKKCIFGKSSGSQWVTSNNHPLKLVRQSQIVQSAIDSSDTVVP